MKFCTPKRLNTAAGVEITALAMPNGVTVKSETMSVGHNIGFLTALLKEAHSGGTGSINVVAEYSFDGTNWYENYTTAAAALTKDSDIVDTLANQTRLITFTARMVPYFRLSFVPNADSVMTADIAFQDEA